LRTAGFFVVGAELEDGPAVELNLRVPGVVRVNVLILFDVFLLAVFFGVLGLRLLRKLARTRVRPALMLRRAAAWA
jgi:hypothetical protein